MTDLLKDSVFLRIKDAYRTAKRVYGEVLICEEIGFNDFFFLWLMSNKEYVTVYTISESQITNKKVAIEVLKRMLCLGLCEKNSVLVKQGGKVKSVRYKITSSGVKVFEKLRDQLREKDVLLEKIYKFI